MSDLLLKRVQEGTMLADNGARYPDDIKTIRPLESARLLIGKTSPHGNLIINDILFFHACQSFVRVSHLLVADIGENHRWMTKAIYSWRDPLSANGLSQWVKNNPIYCRPNEVVLAEIENADTEEEHVFSAYVFFDKANEPFDHVDL